MDNDVAINVENVTMSFILNKEKVDNLKEYAIKLITGKLEYNKFDALKDISFQVKKGEHLAIMGLNGAGKSTLLKTIVGVYKPTKGKIEKQGVIAPLLELGAGLTAIIPEEKIFSFTVLSWAIQENSFNLSMMKLLNFPNSAILLKFRLKTIQAV